MSDIILANNEKLIGLAEAGHPTNTHPSTLSRWCNRGIRRKDGIIVKLEFVRVGSKLKTSAEALHRFFAALSAEQNAQQSTKTADARRLSAEEAMKLMQAMGA